MKARIIFDTTVEFRDALLQESKNQNIRFAPLIRKILRDFLANPHKLYPKGTDESSLDFLPYVLGEGENGDNIEAKIDQ